MHRISLSIFAALRRASFLMRYSGVQNPMISPRARPAARGSGWFHDQRRGARVERFATFVPTDESYTAFTRVGRSFDALEPIRFAGLPSEPQRAHATKVAHLLAAAQGLGLRTRDASTLWCIL